MAIRLAGGCRGRHLDLACRGDARYCFVLLASAIASKCFLAGSVRGFPITALCRRLSWSRAYFRAGPEKPIFACMDLHDSAGNVLHHLGRVSPRALNVRGPAFALRDWVLGKPLCTGSFCRCTGYESEDLATKVADCHSGSARGHENHSCCVKFRPGCRRARPHRSLRSQPGKPSISEQVPLLCPFVSSALPLDRMRGRFDAHCQSAAA